LTTIFTSDILRSTLRFSRRLSVAVSEKHRRGNKVFWALVLIAIGVLILLHNLDYIGEDIVRYWPVAIILLGLKKLID
jgi:hypothetical protein